jgi:radical SAM superfamily enzyme YgiQ (UPF0313 family)
MKENVYLIDLGTGTDRSLLPLGVGLIASYCKSVPEIDDHYDFTVLMLEEGLDELLEEIENPSVIGFSCYVWNFLGSAELSRRLKEKYPEALMVWGGPNIPTRDHRVPGFIEEHQCVDVLVQGEGELTFADLLQKRMNGGQLDQCLGITYRTEDPDSPFVTTAPRDRIQNFSDIPSPFLNGIFDELMVRYGSQVSGVIWETSRGCPFKCTFCDWGNSLVTKVNRYEIDRVIQEIEWVSNRNISYVYSTDANFGITLERDLEIAERFVEISKRNGYPNQMVLNWTKNSKQSVMKIAETLATGGVATNTTITFQSFHEPTLKAIKRSNIKLDVYQQLKEQYHSRNLPTYTELILGLPEETLDSFVDGLERTLTNSLVDHVSIYLLVFLENTELALPEQMEKYALETRTCAVGLNRRRFKYPRFGVEEIIVSTSTMPTPDWERAYEIAFTVKSLHSHRVGFFVMVYLRKTYGLRVVDFMRYIIDEVTASPENYPSFARAITHVRNNRQLILDGVSSVSPVEGGDGVSLTSHEANTFLLLDWIDETYSELGEIARKFCAENGFHIPETVLEDLMQYQKARMPVFAPQTAVLEFHTNMPVVIERLIANQEPPPIVETPTTVDLTFKPHPFGNETEFNLRRVASGFDLSLSGMTIREKIAPVEQALASAD